MIFAFVKIKTILEYIDFKPKSFKSKLFKIKNHDFDL